MITNKTEILNKLTALKPLLQRECNVTELALFGSYARNEQTPKSDIDIMIDMADKSYKRFLRTIDLLEATFPGIKVQVVSKDGIKPAYFEYVKQDLIYA